MVHERSDCMAFRAQLVLPEQRQLFDYWFSRAGSNGLAKRKDINPFDFARLLPGISLVTVDDDISASRVRLAGTRLREIYDREITGLSLSELDLGQRRDYWMTAIRHTAEHGSPTQGVVRGPMLHKQHLVQYWMKLPLTVSGEGRVEMILGFDSFVAAPTLRDAENIESKREKSTRFG
jgi:hypothetical protein